MSAEGLFTDEVACRYQLLNDNLLDLTHIGYLHESTIGTALFASVPETLIKTERTLRSRRDILNYQPSEMISKAFGYPGRVDSVVEFVFYAPGMHSGVGDHFISLRRSGSSGRAAADQPVATRDHVRHRA